MNFILLYFIMFKKIIRFTTRLTLTLSLLALTGLFLPKFVVLLYAPPRIFTADNVPNQRIAIVFGAGLLRNGSAGPVLSDRMKTAVVLYQQGKVEKLLLSGDNSLVEYNEPEAMRQYALQAGIPEDDLVLDYAGRRTYDTCYRAKYIFQAESAILVTQSFHMPRALMLCNWFGIESVGVEADNRYFLKRLRTFWHIRELFANFQAAWDVLYLKPTPIMGEVEPIN